MLWLTNPKRIDSPAAARPCPHPLPLLALHLLPIRPCPPPSRGPVSLHPRRRSRLAYALSSPRQTLESHRSQSDLHPLTLPLESPPPAPVACATTMFYAAAQLYPICSIGGFRETMRIPVSGSASLCPVVLRLGGRRHLQQPRPRPLLAQSIPRVSQRTRLHRQTPAPDASIQLIPQSRQPLDPIIQVRPPPRRQLLPVR
jgi:hypothetical protein